MIAELIFLIVIVALALPGLIVHAFDYGERTQPTPVVTSPPALQSGPTFVGRAERSLPLETGP
jgi:hypothetical protein